MTCRRCIPDVIICDSPLYTERGRRLELPQDNYFFLFYSIMNFIVVLAVVVARPSCLFKLSLVLLSYSKIVYWWCATNLKGFKRQSDFCHVG